MAENSNSQAKKFSLLTGALGYRTRSDATATKPGFLVGGSQNVLVNEATDEGGDKVESRPGYELKGVASTDRYKIRSEFTFKTKSGDTRMLRFDANGNLEFWYEAGAAWETLLTGLSATYPCRFTTVWSATELLRVLLFVNHSSVLYEWSGAVGTISGDTAVTAGTISIQETITTQGFLTAGTRSIRIKDSGGTWRETVYTNQSGSDFTVSTDLSAFTFDANAPVVQVVRQNSNTPASGFTNDVIAVLQNHVYVGSHSSSIVYLSKSTSYADYTFSTPRLATDGWQFVLDDYTVGFITNIGGNGQESMVIFAGNDWIYRVEFVEVGDSSGVAEIARIRPIIVSSGQGALAQELIAKVKNSIVFMNVSNELMELGDIENFSNIQQVPISDPIKPDFLAASFTDGALRFWRNNLYVTAGASGKMFILAFREGEAGVRRFWQPPQILPIGQLSDFDGNLIGHSAGVKESYTLFTGTSDNGKPIVFKAHFAYNNFGNRDKYKTFDKYFVEFYLTSNAVVRLTLVYEYLGAKTSRTYSFQGTEVDFLFVPNPSASLGVNSLGTSPLGAPLESISNFIKYRRFKKVVPEPSFFEMQSRFECDDLDAQFQILCQGPNVGLSNISPSKLTS